MTGAFESGAAGPAGAGGGAGIGGRLRERPEDFLVEELPLYDPSGSGEHLYMLVQKRSMSTLDMVGVLARHFGVPRRDIGYAGLKDKRAVTRQVVSVRLPGRDVSDVPMLRDDRLAILWVDRHENKLRRGHLRGNRFSIRVRGVSLPDVLHAQRTLQRLSREGLPNRIGPQRFGILGNNHLVGRAIVLGEWEEALGHLLGPSPEHPASQPESRAHFARGEYAQAAAAMPGSLRVERAVLRALAAGASPERAMRSMDRAALWFFVTGFQSAVFNAVLTAREGAGTLGTLLKGDVAFMHASQRTFEAGQEEAEHPDTPRRLAGFEISPSGPMWGAEMRRARGEPGEMEREALASSGVSEEAIERFAREGGQIPGTRRPLRVPVIDPDVEAGADEHGTYIRCAFELPRGSFATTVMREVMGDAGPGGDEEEE